MFDRPAGADIAIIGLAGRFPGAKDIHEFWRNLRDKVESIVFLTDDDLENSGIDLSRVRGADFVKARATLDGIDLFDASFFGISHKEAEIMDPQHRIFLECAWEALENASYDAERYQGSIGVYGGATINTYLLCNLAANIEFIDSLDPLQVNIGNGGDFLTTRVSYKLNLKGPSYLVQSACSTSLVAVHTACQSLLNDECDMALAGGVSINVKQRAGYRYVEGGIASPDGHCRAFDAHAQGTIFGSGVGIVVLKRLEDALADGDYIHALIKGSAINNDGSSKIGYTAPSVDGQAEVITEALANAGVPANSISYIEAHGTATPLGDPIEVRALTKAFRQSCSEREFCAIGSVKSNIGHLDAAAGIAGLIKTVLALKHRQLPPSLHYQQPNPQIDFSSTPFYVNDRLQPWPSAATPRRAGVSSFGVGGTNAHVIVEEAPEVAGSGESRRWQLLLLSAKSGAGLERASANLREYLGEHEGVNLADVAYTLQVGRKGFEHRRMVLCRDVAEAIEALTKLDPERVLTSSRERSQPMVAFMFPGQGSQHVRMGAELYAGEAVFREQVDRCAALLNGQLGMDIRAVLNPEAYGVEEGVAEEQLQATQMTQPALFVIEYALAKLWESWGVRAEAMIGHSLGEYVAACLAGVMTLEEGLRLVAARGRMMQEVESGAMTAVPLPEEEVRRWLDQGVSLAAVNGKKQCVVSGEVEAVQKFEEKVKQEREVRCQRLKTSHGFHSRMMERMVKGYLEELKRVQLKEPERPYISNVSGKWIRAEEACDEQYWVRQLLEPVRFATGIEELLGQGNRVLLETGPGQTLTRLAKRHLNGNGEPLVLASMRQPKDRQADDAYLLLTLGKLWLGGVEIDGQSFFRHQRRLRLPLPTYPFERQRYWIEPRAGKSNGSEGEVVVSHSASPADVPQVSSSLHPRPELSNTYVAPVTKYEQAIAEIWQRALGIKQVGIYDNFFDLGGDSLIAIEVMSRLKEKFNAEVSAVSMYEGLTIKSLIGVLGLEHDDNHTSKQFVAETISREERSRRRKQYELKQRARHRS